MPAVTKVETACGPQAVHSSSQEIKSIYSRVLGNLRQFAREPPEPHVQYLCCRTVGLARCPQYCVLHKPSLSFTLQFKKNFKLPRLHNTGVLAEITNFEPLTRRRRRRRRPEAMVVVVGVRVSEDGISRRHQFLHDRIQPRPKTRMPPSTGPSWSGLGRWKGRKQAEPLALLTCSRRGAAWKTSLTSGRAWYH